jgi:mono/diheme cytochrome c family protein
MMKLRLLSKASAGVLSAGLVLAVSALALAANGAPSRTETGPVSGDRVDNFMLADQFGVGHELFYHAAQPAIVIVTTAIGDPASSRAIEEVSRLRESYAAKGVEFFFLNSKLGDDRFEIEKAFASVQIPVLSDDLQLVGRSMGVTSTAEAFVINPKTWTVAYHGPVDASFAKKKVKGASLQAALDAVLAGRQVQATDIAVKGETLAFPDRAKVAQFSKISYSTEVAPILAEKCVVCHTEGGLAPFAMNNYTTVKGFAPMIRESIRTKRMPPFHADPHWGSWENDMNLTDSQVKTIVNWVEAGAPRGEGPDPLPSAAKPAPEWPLGEPDLIVKIPGYDVPATGLVDYQDWSIPTGLTEGKWLKATSWRAGAVPTVHHVLAGWMPEVRADGRGFSWNTSLGGYGPGGESNLSPDATGTYIPPGGSFSFQMHYTPVGKPMRDETRVGLYFHKDDPKYILRQASVTDFSLEIPAGAARHKERAYLEFPHDALIYGTQPHCHSRCYATKLTIRYPDGAEKVLLTQPRYDFGWQREYIFEDLLEVPAGSKLIADYVFDNSAANKSNPDASKDVTFGEQTSEEMLFTFVRYRWKDETSTTRKDDYQRDLQNNIMFGALDDNIDGKLEVAEFRNSPRFAPFKQFLPMVDKNKDGGLDKVELASAMEMMQKMRRPGAAAAPAPDKGTAAMTGESR